MLRYWLFFNQSTWALVSNFNDSAQLYFAAGIYCLHGKLTAVWNFTSVKLTEVKFAPKWVSLCPDSCEHWKWSYLTPKWNFTPKLNLKPVWAHFESHVNVLLDVVMAWCLSAKNYLLNSYGYVPNQLVFGYNPSFQSVLNNQVPVQNGVASSELRAAHLNSLHAARTRFIET